MDNIYIVAELKSFKKPYKTLDFKFNYNFLEKLYEYKNIIESSKSKTAIWGASSKGVIFSMLLKTKCNIELDYVIYINPLKQGKYMALSKTKIISPQNFIEISGEDTLIIIMNKNYENEIKKMTNIKYRYMSL